MSFRVTKATDYAIRAMIHLACLPADGVALRSDIATAQGIPNGFMAKVLRRLVRAGLLRSTRGVNGGFALARLASHISVLDVFEAIDGPLRLAECVPDREGCVHPHRCPANPLWVEAQEALRRVLGAASLEDLVSKRMLHGRTFAAQAGIGRAERRSPLGRSFSP
jgi:Rrf2 family protein